MTERRTALYTFALAVAFIVFAVAVTTLVWTVSDWIVTDLPLPYRDPEH